ncbi:hypothetical protein BBJ28_00013596 [Nothophytophthora sp. Chile5]|nr:hypothetical protein BBJ28_00013596 [Nothophytophthora sp. Chile5]
MGTKRRNAAEPSAGFSAVSTERPPPLKAPRTALDSAPSSAASRFGFGFKGPSLTKLPPPAAASRTNHAAPPVRLGAESARPLPISIDLDLHVRDSFAGSFSSETLASLDELLAFRHKTNKFAVKARKEERIAYIKRLKAALRDVAGKAQEFSTTAATMDSKITSEKATLERRIAVLQEAARSKEQADREVGQLRDQNEELKKLVTRLHASEQEATCRNATLQDDSALLQQQLQEARKLQDQMKLDLATQKTRLADQTQHFESEKSELERFYQKKALEEDLHKQKEVDRLQDELSKARAETSAALQELSALKDKAVASAEELNRERERRTKSEMEKCTLEAKNQALDARVNSAMSEAVELKDKFKQKDEEVSNLVKSLTEIQKFNASASSKVDTEKKELTEKIEKLQASNRDLERKEATSNTTIRDLRKQLEVCRLAGDRFALDLPLTID